MIKFLCATVAILLFQTPAWAAPVPFPKPEKPDRSPRRLLHSMDVMWNGSYMTIECFSGGGCDFFSGERWQGRWVLQKDGHFIFEMTSLPERQRNKKDLGKYRIVDRHPDRDQLAPLKP